MIIEFGVQRQRWEGMKGYESCYDCEYETQEEGAGKHSKKITNRDEEGRGVEGVSCIHLAIGGDATGRQREANSTITTEVNMSVMDAETLKRKHGLYSSSKNKCSCQKYGPHGVNSINSHAYYTELSLQVQFIGVTPKNFFIS